jgi:hypothetical protein
MTEELIACTLDARIEEAAMSKRDDLERQLDLAATLALRTRERIEAAVNTGEAPAWIIDACSVLERASLQYGELAEQLRPAEAGIHSELPEAALGLQSLTLH